MHTHSIELWQHSHVFLGAKHDRHERRTWIVVALTAAMMVAEIVGGTLFGSMAVVADGWHMSTHAGALTIAALAYRFARRHAHDPRFTFGTGKMGELAAFCSAVILALIAAAIGYEALMRLTAPVAIHFREAIPLAAVGLLVNLASAWLLFDSDHHHGHAHGDDHDHDHGHHHHDASSPRPRQQSARGLCACARRCADLGAGDRRADLRLAFGWVWLDPLMALVGVAVILSWSFGLIRSAGTVLLDMVPDRHLAGHIRKHLEIDGDRVCDLHLWRLGPGHVGLIAAVVSDHPQAPSAYKHRLEGIAGLSHITIEVHRCPDHERKAA